MRTCHWHFDTETEPDTTFNDTDEATTTTSNSTGGGGCDAGCIAAAVVIIIAGIALLVGITGAVVVAILKIVKAS